MPTWPPTSGSRPRTLYPVRAFPLSRAKWRDHFGSAFGQLGAAKQEFDPGKILTPGYEIF
jgi:cytokinin dehydrogenase